MKVWGWIVAAFAAVVAGVAWFSRINRDDRLTKAAREEAQAAQREDIEDKLAADRLVIQTRREREREAIQDELETDLLQVETDLPGAVADALRDARGGGDNATS